MNLEHLRGEAVERGLITEDQIQQALELLEDPTVPFNSSVMFSVWGQRPAC